VVLARYARNGRLADAVSQWAMASLNGSPGARAYHDTMRTRGIGHRAALRQLANRLVGTLHGCLKTHTLYDETTAWALARRRLNGGKAGRGQTSSATLLGGDHSQGDKHQCQEKNVRRPLAPV
jgi:hypothetical protein